MMNVSTVSTQDYWKNVTVDNDRIHLREVKAPLLTTVDFMLLGGFSSSASAPAAPSSFGASAIVLVKVFTKKFTCSFFSKG